jgi:ubiquinone/menaquinone biosynthesis C-methylase UbiE
MPARALAKQLAHPSGLTGRFILAPLWNRRNVALNDAAFDSLALRPHDRVLEVGFGGGYLLGRMASVVTDAFLAGVDLSPAMVAFCRGRYRALIETGRLELRCAKAEALPYSSASFSKVCTVNSIFYWESAPQAISELWRALEKDGTLVLCFTCRQSMEHRRFARHGITLHGTDDVEKMMKAAGFREVSFTRSSDQHREFWHVVGRR